MTRSNPNRPITIPPARMISAGQDSVRPAGSARRFATMFTAGALVITLGLSAALPARAEVEGKDLAKLLIGALVVGAIIHETKKDDRKPAPQPAEHGPDRPYPGAKPWDRPEAPRVPAVCAIEIDGNSGSGAQRGDNRNRKVAFYPEACLRDRGMEQRDLPRNCATDATLFGQRDRVYSADCLRESGLRLK